MCARVDKDDPSVVHIKVGRAVKLNKRLGEWDDQCQSKETHLRGYWPMSEDAESNGMMRGRVQVGPPGPYCHRVERLVHLELADLALNAPYLHPDFPNVKSDVGIGNGGKRSAVRRECPDCETPHLFLCCLWKLTPKCDRRCGTQGDLHFPSRHGTL